MACLGSLTDPPEKKTRKSIEKMLKLLTANQSASKAESVNKQPISGLDFLKYQRV